MTALALSPGPAAPGPDWLARGPSLSVPDRERLVDAVYEAGGNLIAACRLLGLTVRAALRTREADPDFARELLLAEEVRAETIAGQLMELLTGETLKASEKLALAKQLVKQCPPSSWLRRTEAVKATAKAATKIDRPSPRTTAATATAAPTPAPDGASDDASDRMIDGDPPESIDGYPAEVVRHLRSLNRGQRRAEAKRIAAELVSIGSGTRPPDSDPLRDGRSGTG